MSWLHVLALGVASIASMRIAFERGDVDEAARQGVLAGPAVIEAALAAPDRPARFAAIAAAPAATGRAGLLDALAVAAAGPDRRTAIPAAHAARRIARGISTRDLPDDLAPEDLIAWRDAWVELALRGDRWIELRVYAVDTAAALDPEGTGVPLAAALADPDPALRRAAIMVVPTPVPAVMRTAVAGAVVADTDPTVALAAAAVLCFDLAIDAPGPVLDALGTAGLARIRSLVTGPGPRTALRDAKRCLTAAAKRRR